ncbi:venom protease-like [Chrysoperla carnea]|uniref:venom protease-like n=1 Tax=Chrysoperla carnea TaxID=189513 RepID=UPI001D082E46|nr:venom protease-like [Chrysoperla carnea]
MFLLLMFCALSKISPGACDNCVTPKNENGTCIPIKLCPPLMQILLSAQYRYTPQLAELRKYTCGFSYKVPLVCCPISVNQSQPLIPTSTTTSTTIAPRITTRSNLPTECGTSASQQTLPRIIGGYDIKKGQFPWMVALGYENSTANEIQWSCGGTIITKRHVLTAAHCVFNQPELKYIRIGVSDIKKDWDYWEGEILESYVHENFRSGLYKHDIAILKIDFDMDNLGPLVGPVCLPTDPKWKNQSFVRYYPIVSGWGVTKLGSTESSEILQGLQIPIISNSICELKYNGTINFDRTLLCAGYQKGLKDSCSGDSGGPLLLPQLDADSNETIFYQIGIVSSGFNCADPKHPGIYLRVSEYIEWIESKLIFDN